MRKAIWVLENVDGNREFYTSVKILMLLSSVINWKRYNETNNALHTDSMTLVVLSNLEVLDLWDEIHTNIIDQETVIDKRSYWASSKLRVLINQTEPVTLVDYDFITYTNLTELGKDSAFVYSYDENGTQSYFGGTNPDVKKLNNIPDFLKRSKSLDAANVSYLSFNDIEFQLEYAKYSLACIEEFSEMGVKGTSYLTFAEQKILKQLALHLGVKHVPLIKNEFKSSKQEFINVMNPDGIWHVDDANFKFKHIGTDKAFIKNGDPTFIFLCNSIRSKIDQAHLDRILELDQPL